MCCAVLCWPAQQAQQRQQLSPAGVGLACCTNTLQTPWQHGICTRAPQTVQHAWPPPPKPTSSRQTNQDAANLALQIACAVQKPISIGPPALPPAVQNTPARNTICQSNYLLSTQAGCGPASCNSCYTLQQQPNPRRQQQWMAAAGTSQPVNPSKGMLQLPVTPNAHSSGVQH
jgi:hypothetical protein